MAQKALFAKGGKEPGCTAHARWMLFELHANHSSLIAVWGLKFLDLRYDVERDVKALNAKDRNMTRQEKAKPDVDGLHKWLSLHRRKIPDGSATTRSTGLQPQTLGGADAHLYDGQIPIDNNWCENQIGSVALGRGNWLFAGSLRGGKRAAIMRLIQSAMINGHDPYAYMKDILTRLPTQGNSRSDELLQHGLKPQT